MKQSIEEQIEELRSLGVGWLEDEPGSLPPSPELLAMVQAEVEAFTAAYGWGAPYLFPMPHGGVQAVWDTPEVNLDVGFSPDGTADVRLAIRRNKNRTFQSEVVLISGWKSWACQRIGGDAADLAEKQEP